MNKQIKVVVVDDNEAVLNEVIRSFGSNESIRVVGNFRSGKEALNYLVSKPYDYDLIILDLVLPEYDGLKIMEELQNQGIKKKIIVTSSIKDDYTIRKIQGLGASYYMLKPIDVKVLEHRVMDIAKENEPFVFEKKYKVEAEVSSLLHDLGIPTHIRGYKYIRDGILLLYNNDNVTTLVTKEVYPHIADKYETTSTRVERAIRHAIEISWARGDIKLMEEIFGNSVDFERSRPTNAEFLSTLADRFRINYLKTMA